MTDARKVEVDFGWRPTRDPARIVRDIRAWIEEHRRNPGKHPGLNSLPAPEFPR